MLQKISSIKITFFSLCLLIGTMLAGVALTVDKHYGAALKSLSRQLPLKWLLNESHNNVIITFWFVAVCMVASLFFIHLLCCIATRILRLVQSGFSLRQWLFFLLHMMFAVVMLCHGLSMIIGYKHSDIILFAGQTIRFDKDFVLSMNQIEFVDDPAILKAPYPDQRTLMTRENIHRDKNFAQFDLFNDAGIFASGRIYMLAPFRFGSIQITLTDFFIPENRPDDPIGVKMVITKNPVILLFLGSYTVMIISFIGFVVVTWRVKGPQTTNSANEISTTGACHEI